ncbi:hypothetical protein IWQ48_001766 [Labrenzia sp. EL_13]|nr:hypothetical protein [Labrenzia sp. EL_13]MCR9057680.1 YwqG family protein [Paracoccaceae bacterium]
MVKFALYLLVLVILAYGSQKLGFSGLHFLFLVAILGSVACMVLWPLFRQIFEATASVLPTKSNREQHAEPHDINDERVQQVLTKEQSRVSTVREEPASAVRKDIVPELVSVSEGDPDASFDSLREHFARNAVYAFRPYPPHREKHGRSKVGGLPSLPKNVPWPKAPGAAGHVKAGLPLHFLAQIDLADLPWRPEGIPETGLLLFFGRFDESLTWAEPDVAPQNDMQVLYDAEYSGTATAFPKNLPPIKDGNYHFDLLFGLPGDEKTRVFPEWPLNFAKVETMPESAALPFASPEGYDSAHKHHLTAQLTAAFATMETDNADICEFHLFQPRTEEERAEGKPLVLRPHSETGFPFAPRGMSLICRILRNRHGAKLEETGFETCFEDWQMQAETLKESKFEQRMVNAFIEDLNDFLEQAADKRYSAYLKADIERALHRLVTETGGSPNLSKLVPEAVYAAASDRHPVFLKDENGIKCPEFPGARSGNCYHQMFGHLSSVQFNLPHDSAEQLLLQLFNDWGAEMSIRDGGEFDFMIEESDLHDHEFDRVKAACGGH